MSPRNRITAADRAYAYGTVADQEIAELEGVTRSAIAQRRKARGIPAAGAPTGPKPRGERAPSLTIGLTVDERNTLATAAAAEEESISAWVRDAALEKARKSAKRDA